jgi:hypothetical protein
MVTADSVDGMRVHSLKIANTFFSLPSLLHCSPELYTASTATQQRGLCRILNFLRFVNNF